MFSRLLFLTSLANIHTLDPILRSPDTAAHSLGSMACIMFVKDHICFAYDYCLGALQFRSKRKWK